MIAYAQECSKCVFTSINSLNPPCAVGTIIILTEHISLEHQPHRSSHTVFPSLLHLLSLQERSTHSKPLTLTERTDERHSERKS